jgi:hypothetical protein
MHGVRRPGGRGISAPNPGDFLEVSPVVNVALFPVGVSTPDGNVDDMVDFESARAFDPLASLQSGLEYARTGQGEIEDASSRLSRLPLLDGRDLHVFALLPETIASNRHSILFHAQIYGGPVICLRLAGFTKPLKDLLMPIVVLVDYQKHRIETTTEEQYEAMVSGPANEVNG